MKIEYIERFEYQAGKPFRVMPIGTFKRGERTLEITPQRLQEMAANYANNKPRWKIPLYFGHPTSEQPDPPKVGNVKQLFVKEDGLYAEPEWTSDGEKTVKDGGYQFVSPGVLWSLNGSAYTDEQGQSHDNVIDHVALTNKPFFGANTALFSADAEVQQMADTNPVMNKGMLQNVIDMLRKLLGEEQQEDAKEAAAEKASADTQPDEFKTYDTETRREMAKKGEAMPDGSYPIADAADLQNAIHAIGRGGAPHATIKAHIVKRAKALGKTDLLPADWQGSTKEKGAGNMSDTQKPETLAAPQVTAEEFAALKAKADQVDAIKAQADTFAEQLKKAEEQLSAVQRARRLDQLKVRCDNFVAIPEKSVTLAERFAALEQVSRDLFKYFDDLIEKADKALVEAGLFSQYGSGAAGVEQTDDFATAVDKVVADKFGGDMTKYGDALHIVEKQRPDLAQAYKVNVGKGARNG